MFYYAIEVAYTASGDTDHVFYGELVNAYRVTEDQGIVIDVSCESPKVSVLSRGNDGVSHYFDMLDPDQIVAVRPVPVPA